MYSYNKLSWQQSELFHLLKKLGESITPSKSKDISTLLCSWAGMWSHLGHCSASLIQSCPLHRESPLHSAGWTTVCSFEEQTFWKDSGGHSRWEEMSVLLLGSLWDVARILNHCHFIIFRCSWVAQWCLTLCNPVDCSPPGSLSMEFSRQNTGVGCYFLLQEIFLTQGLNPHLLNWQADSLSLSTWEAQFIGATA